MVDDATEEAAMVNDRAISSGANTNQQAYQLLPSPIVVVLFSLSGPKFGTETDLTIDTCCSVPDGPPAVILIRIFNETGVGVVAEKSFAFVD
uniref:Uncharacterized protein n=1 Tax=Romanomermis culicivorax TaxID=13658 RepID=A0A915IN21_ROMCU